MFKNYKKYGNYTLISLGLMMSSGCATWSTSSVDNIQSSAATGSAIPSNPAEILVTEQDITTKRYRVIGDITTTVNKTTLFHPDPTPEMVKANLREEAAKMGADAVIQVRFGNTGVSPMSWGSLEGKGRAVKFEN